MGACRPGCPHSTGSVWVSTSCTAWLGIQLTFAHPGFIITTIQACQGTRDTGGTLGSSGAGPGSLSHPTPARGRAARGTRATPALGIGHLPGEGARLGWDVGPWVGVRISPGEGNRAQTWPGTCRQGHGDDEGAHKLKHLRLCPCNTA